MIVAEDIMSDNVIRIHDDMLIRQVAHMMLRDRVSGLIVVDSEDRVIGIITMTDLFLLIDKAAHHNSVPDFYEALPKIKEKKVGELMSSQVISIKPDTTLPEIIQLLLEKNMHTFPVLVDDKIVGIVSRHDILNAAYCYE